jgi:hypothetical protein
MENDTAPTHEGHPIDWGAAIGPRDAPEPPPPEAEGLTLDEIAEQGDKPDPAKGSPEWAAQILEGLAPRVFDPDNPPPDLAPVVTLKGTPVGTAGNLVLLSGQAGSAKSHSLAAIMASALAPEGTEPDCLGWAMPNPRGRAVTYLDFEQSEQDFHALIRGAMRRAGVDTLPPWFTALHLTGTDPDEGRKILHALLVDARARFGGTLATLLDGIADLCRSPNDEAEAFALVRELHGWADEFQTVAFSVLHLNAGADSLKMRGHLGSQAERKAETVLTAKRTGETIAIYATKTRHRPIPEAAGSRFAWDEEAGGFATVATVAEERADRKAEERRELARAIFAGQADGLTHAEAVARIVELEAIKADAAKKRLAVLRNQGFLAVQVATGLYHLKGGKQ